jgi:LuxR family maltose regulon positive regulatory protein
LRFTPEESAAFLDAALPAPLNRSSVAVLEQRTEGWIAGLRLATLSLHTEDEVAAALESLSSAEAGIADYLVDEVLSRQPSAIQLFLLKTAILDQFSAPLCEAMVDSDDAEFTAPICLEWIERANLFIIPLDNHNEWYRYHHLFQEVLQRRLQTVLGSEQICDLHCRAVDWLARHGRVEEALQHALTANDLDLAARLMERGLCDVLNREDRPTLERWLRLLPEEIIVRRPGMLMIKAWALQLSWQLDAQSKVIK